MIEKLYEFIPFFCKGTVSRHFYLCFFFITMLLWNHCTILMYISIQHCCNLIWYLGRYVLRYCTVLYSYTVTLYIPSVMYSPKYPHYCTAVDILRIEQQYIPYLYLYSCMYIPLYVGTAQLYIPSVLKSCAYPPYILYSCTGTYALHP